MPTVAATALSETGPLGLAALAGAAEADARTTRPVAGHGGALPAPGKLPGRARIAARPAIPPMTPDRIPGPGCLDGGD